MGEKKRGLASGRGLVENVLPSRREVVDPRQTDVTSAVGAVLLVHSCLSLATGLTISGGMTPAISRVLSPLFVHCILCSHGPDSAPSAQEGDIP